MGGGRNYRDDVKRRGGKDLLQAASGLTSGLEASGGAIASSEEFCAAQHRLQFHRANGLTPKAGEAVELLAGEPLQIVGVQGIVGLIESDQVAALNSCLGLSWTMTGTVASVDAMTGKGIVLVAGER
jgi:hypothetical protein